MTAAKLRASRSLPVEARPFRATERDAWLLEAIGKMRFVTTGQLAALGFGGSRWSANKRLRKLLDQGLVRAWVRGLSEENVYSLTRLGVRFLAERGEPADSAPKGLDGNLNHLLATNDVRVALALGLPAIGSDLKWWRSDWDLRSHFRERVIPDALFAVARGGEDQVFTLELDNCTRSPRRFLAKILAYASVRDRGLYGVRDFLVLVVRDPSWLGRYREAVIAARIGRTIYFTNLDAVKADAVAPIWTSIDSDKNLSLRALITLPYGKEGEVPETIQNHEVFS
jgi:hypothetical protein